MKHPLDEREKPIGIQILVAVNAVDISIPAALTVFPGEICQAPKSWTERAQIPPGYRDWRLISVAHEEGNLNDLRAILGNDAAIKACREGKLPFPVSTIIARLAWSYVSGLSTFLFMIAAP